MKTRFGNLQDILSSNPYEENVFVIDSPFITNGLFKKIYAHGSKNVEYINCVASKESFNLKEEINGKIGSFLISENKVIQKLEIYKLEENKFIKNKL